MKISAVVCEYNPFHNGHKFQLDIARAELQCDAIVGIMSGNFVQRGDAAIFPKEYRAAAAIASGMDLVLELPAVLTLQSAERYASNAVETLNSMGCIDTLFFGAECPDTDILMSIASVLANEDSSFQSALKHKLSQGLSFANARAEAVRTVIGSASAEILSKPNNILAVEYCKALIRHKSNIKPHAIARKEVNHDEIAVSNGFASATAIRERIFNNLDIAEFVPIETLNLSKAVEPFDLIKMERTLISNLFLMPIDKLRNIADVSEGLENALKRAAYTTNSVNKLIEQVKSKRYAYSRIRRIILNAYLGITKDDTALSPSYIRILDFNEKGRAVLNYAKGTATLPLAKNGGQIKDNPKALALWQREMAIDKVYDLFYE